MPRSTRSNKEGHKIVILGDSSVGKSSMVRRLISNIFIEHNESTIGAAFCQFRKNDILFDIWDTAGQEKYRSITPMYYRSAEIAIIVFDVSNIKSYVSVKYWIKELRRNDINSTKIFVVGNKVDMAHDFVAYGDDIDYKIYYTSAKDGTGINELFDDIASYIKVHTEFIKQTSHMATNHYLDDDDTKNCYCF